MLVLILYILRIVMDFFLKFESAEDKNRYCERESQSKVCFRNRKSIYELFPKA